MPSCIRGEGSSERIGEAVVALRGRANGENAASAVAETSTSDGPIADQQSFFAQSSLFIVRTLIRLWRDQGGQFDAAFTIDAARFVPLGRNADNSLQFDYVGEGGDSIEMRLAAGGEHKMSSTISVDARP